METKFQEIVPDPEFMQDLSAKDGGVVVWQDMTKLGKISGKDLSYCADNLGNILRYHPNKSIAFVVAPILISEKTSNNSRDEMRRIEDKYLAKGLATYMVTIRMEIPPTTKKVPLVFHGWLVLDASSESENIFKQCQLMQDRRWGYFVAATIHNPVL